MEQPGAALLRMEKVIEANEEYNDHQEKKRAGRLEHGIR
jgi:hypothetical protein